MLRPSHAVSHSLRTGALGFLRKGLEIVTALLRTKCVLPSLSHSQFSVKYSEPSIRITSSFFSDSRGEALSKSDSVFAPRFCFHVAAVVLVSLSLTSCTTCI